MRTRLHNITIVNVQQALTSKYGETQKVTQIIRELDSELRSANTSDFEAIAQNYLARY